MHACLSKVLPGALLGILLGAFIAYPVMTLPAYGLTLFICIDPGGGKTYLDKRPTDAACEIEEMEVDPDANVIPATDFVAPNVSDSTTPRKIAPNTTYALPDIPTEPNASVTQQQTATRSTTTKSGTPGISGQSAAGNTIAPSAAPAAAAPAAAAGGF